MKKVLLLMVLVAGISQVKAQTITQPLLSNKPYWNPFIKPKTNTGLFKTPPILPRVDEPKSNNNIKIWGAIANNMVYNMPIVKLPSTDRMPIVKTDEPGMRYNMPIAGYNPVKDSVNVIP